MLFIFINILLSVVFAGLIHEMGHFIIALGYGHFLQFEFSWGRLWRIPIPRYVWYMPEELPVQAKRHVALSGFGFEILAIPIFYILIDLMIYPIIVLLHLITYKFYAGADNDFKWLGDLKVIAWVKRFLRYINDKFFNGRF